MRVRCPDCRTPFDVPDTSEDVECPHCGKNFSVITEAPTLTHQAGATENTSEAPTVTGPRVRIYCPACGKELTLPQGQRFGKCPDCGTDLEEDAADETLPSRPARKDTDPTVRTVGTAPTESMDEPGAQARAWLEAHLSDRYEIRKFIARGGMGAVYRARQKKPSREVALKVMLSGAFASAAQRKRFEREAQAVARLNHPAIVPVYEFGEVAGQPYFTMEFVEGLDLATYCHTNRLRRPEIARLMVRVCDAVHYAHERGVIHRDLKPGNIIVDELKRPRILDFGLSRPTAESAGEFSMLTATGDFLGTPRYMAPEQTIGRPGAVDRRTDVYALGVMLYELLCGMLPYPLQHARGLQVFEMIRHAEPVRPSAVLEGFPRDLEVIALKPIEKEKERRYQTAEELAQDLENFLADRPIAARPATAGYRLRKWGWRNRRVLTPVALSVLALLSMALFFRGRIAHLVERVGELGRTVEFRQTELERFLMGAESGRARVEDLVAAGEWQEALWGAEFFAEHLPDEAGVDDLPLLVRRRAESAVADALAELRGALDEMDYEQARLRADRLADLAAALPDRFEDLRARANAPAEEFEEFCWTELQRAVQEAYTRQGATARIHAFLEAMPETRHSGDARRLLQQMDEHGPEFYLARHEAATLQALERHRWEEAGAVLESARQMLAEQNDPTAQRWAERFQALRARLESVMTTADLGRLALLHYYEAHGAFIKDLLFTPDGTLLVSVALASPVRLWNTADWTPAGSLHYEGQADCAALSADGDGLAVGLRDGRVLLWSLRARGTPTVLDGGGGRVRDLAFSPEGQKLVSAHTDALIVWDLRTGRPADEQAYTGQAPAALSPDGRWLAAKADNESVGLWDTETGRQAALLPAERARLLRFSPESSMLAVAYRPDGSRPPVVGLWEVDGADWTARFEPSRARVLTMHFSADARLLGTVTGSVQEKFVAYRRPSDGRHVGRLELQRTPWAAAISPDCRRLVVGHNNGDITVWGLPRASEPTSSADWPP